MFSLLSNLMPSDHAPLRNVRLDTLVRVRWITVIGQTVAVLLVRFGLGFDLPIRACLAVIALSAWLNVVLRVRFGATQRLESDRAALLLAFDVGELAVLLFLTGGLQNPFSFLFLGPVLFSATALPPRMTLMLGAFAIACATVLVFVHDPLPWDSSDPLVLPAIYMLGVWLSIALAIGFIGAYAWQITDEGRKLSDALAATELVLARVQHLSQLDGLAAAAAHELGTPLSTITLVSKELERGIPSDSRFASDVKLLREQAQRCKGILAKLTELPDGGGPLDEVKLSSLIEEVVAPNREVGGVTINVTLSSTDGSPEPISARNPAVLYGLGNLIENAADFAVNNVEISARWTATEVTIAIADDGPGFAPAIIDRVGEPYVTSRPRGRPDQDDSGMGLGIFIARNLLERAGATLRVQNQAGRRGALVTVQWGRNDFELEGPQPEPILSVHYGV